MLIKAEQSLLLLVDVQEKLTPYVQQHQELVANCSWLIQVAQALHIPVMVSEQYPQGLGATVTELQPQIQQPVAIQKVHFSCAADPAAVKTINAQEKEHIILIGIEAHVCVLQTAVELAEQGKEVFVVADAVSSRSHLDYKYALKRMRDLGINIVTREMVFFEWLRKAGTAEFKELSKRFLR